MDEHGNSPLPEIAVILGDEQGTIFWAVLAVLLVASLLFSSVVLYGAWHQSQNRLFLYRLQARYLAQAAVAQAQSQVASRADSEMADTLTITDTLAGHQRWSTTVSPWGCYLRAVCTGASHQAVHSMDVLLGRSPSAAFDYSVRLFGPPYPLVVAGQTSIIGNVSTGPGGASSGQYRGRDRIDTILVRGSVVTDPPPEPIPIDWRVWDEFTSRINELRSDNPVTRDRTLIVDDDWNWPTQDSVIVVDAAVAFTRTLPLSLLHPVALLTTGPVTISGRTLIDSRLVIRSDRLIVVEDSADVAGVILWAPHVEIKGNAQFAGQAIADTLLAVSGEAQTHFPTLLWVASATNYGGAPTLTLKSVRWCEGIAGISAISGPWEWTYASERSGRLILDPHAGWRGYLYISGKAEIQGTVAGSINAELLAVEDPPTTYLNWLLDAKVSRPAWSGSAILPAIMNSGQGWGVAEYIEIDDRASDTDSVP